MTLTYSYDPTFTVATRARLDHARTIIGDTDVTNVEGDFPYSLSPDETYIGAFATYGWSGGLVFLCTALLTRFGQEPTKYAIANGVSYQMSDRIAMWRDLRNRAEAGLVADPAVGTGVSVPTRTEGTSAGIIPTW